MASSPANRGKAWQRILSAAHDRYRRDRIACIHRVDPPTKIIKMMDRGQFIGCWEAYGPPDYLGSVTSSGRHIVFDAKASESRSWPMSSLKLHQAQALEAAPAAIAGIALRMGTRAWFISWKQLGPLYWAWKSGHGVASVNVALADRIGYAFDAATGDWFHSIPMAEGGPFA